jgi:hypothetical protein
VLALILCLVIPPGGVAAQGTPTTLAELVSPLSIGVTRLDDSELRDLRPCLAARQDVAERLLDHPTRLRQGHDSIPVNLVVGKLFAGRWNLSVPASGHPSWTSSPSKKYELILSVGYQLPALWSKP